MRSISFLLHKFLLIIGLSFGISSCSGPDISAYKDADPALSLERFFAGKTVAYGIFEDRFGQLKRQFRVEITGTQNDGEFVLDEAFIYDDGESARRIWKITNLGKDENGFIRYKGEADDVMGYAEGYVSGNILNWAYDIELDIGDQMLKVRFEDFIYQMSDQLAINRAHVTKWGIELCTVTLVFLRGDLAQSALPVDLEVW